jgi:hypothetical protein
MYVFFQLENIPFPSFSLLGALVNYIADFSVSTGMILFLSFSLSIWKLCWLTFNVKINLQSLDKLYLVMNYAFERNGQWIGKAYLFTTHNYFFWVILIIYFYSYNDWFWVTADTRWVGKLPFHFPEEFS